MTDCGRAPEVLQGQLAHDLTPHGTPAPELAPPVEEARSKRWWIVDESGNTVLVSGETVQSLLNDSQQDRQVLAEDQTGGWLSAQYVGFVIEPKAEGVAGITDEVGVARTPQEEALETLPDEELVALAEKNGVVVTPLEGFPGTFDRVAVVKKLAGMGVVP